LILSAAVGIRPGISSKLDWYNNLMTIPTLLRVLNSTIFFINIRKFLYMWTITRQA